MHSLNTFVNIKYDMAGPRNSGNKPPHSSIHDTFIPKKPSPAKNQAPLLDNERLKPPVQSEREADRNERPSSDEDPLIGTVLKNRYQITEKLGQGGMGAVYKAKFKEVWNGKVVTDKEVAVKIVHPLPSGSRIVDAEDEKAAYEDGVARFVREVNIATTLEHENIVRVMEFIVVRDSRTGVETPGCVMELIEGVDLSNHIYGASEQMGQDRAIDIICQCCEGLQYAHERGVVHRDIKPANILIIEREGKEIAKVNDFGLAKKRNLDENHTQAGAVFGTPAYMSPEQIKGEKHDDPRMDVYSLGVTLYEMLTKKVPFDIPEKANLFEAQRMVVYDEPMDMRTYNQHVPAWLVGIVMRCMEKDPANRFQTMKDLKTALESHRKKAQVAPTQRYLGTPNGGLKAKPPTPKPQRKSPPPAKTRVVPAPLEAEVPAIEVSPQMEKPRSRKPLVAGALAIAIAAAGTMIALTRQLHADKLPPVQKAQLVETVGGESEVHAKKPGGFEPAPLAPIQNPQKTHRITIKTEPIGVDVKLGDGFCITKKDGCVLEVAEGSEPKTLILTKTGHIKVERTITPDSDREMELFLKPLIAPKAPEPKKAEEPKLPQEKKPEEQKPPEKKVLNIDSVD